MMARNYKELQSKLQAAMTLGERRAHRVRLERAIAEVSIGQMRKARNLSQVAVAAKLGTDQGSISRMEKQSDMRVRTLRCVVEAAGGQLEVRAVFPNETMTLRIGD